MERVSAWLTKMASVLRDFADRIQPPAHTDLSFQQILQLPGASRLDWSALDRNEVRISYCATDPVWHGLDKDRKLVELREHVRRLCLAVREMSDSSSGGEEWTGVAENLALACSLTDLFADTDLDGASLMCSPAADYESVNGELTEKYLASTIVFTFVWTAYECAVDAIAPGGGGKGAKGRNLITRVADGHMPHMRECLMRALELDQAGTDFRHVEMLRVARLGSIPGVAAEYLRQFRNRLIHGGLARPEPKDWGAGSKYSVNDDVNLRRLHANTRLLLLILQLLVRDFLKDGQIFEIWVESPCSAKLAMECLHCAEYEVAETEPELDLGIASFAAYQ